MTLKKRSNRAATLADVGREAGVSAMAASAVLNAAKTSTRISPETRKRILAAAERLNYRANVAARALADRRMNTIGVAAVIEGGELNHYFLEVFNGILEGARANSQNTTVFTLQDWHKDSQRLRSFCDGRIDGMILIGPDLSPDSARELPAHTPFVAIHPNQRTLQMDLLECHEEQGALEMVRHLIQQGHRHIIHLAGNGNLTGAQRRISGYRKALQGAGIDPLEDWVIEAGFSIACGRDAMQNYLDKSQSTLPDAIFCASDAIATGAMEALAAKGVRVPDAVSIAGFDDSLLARTTRPQLSTVRQPLRQMGHDAVKRLIQAIEQRDTDGSTAKSVVEYPTELVFRSSVSKRS